MGYFNKSLPINEVQGLHNQTDNNQYVLFVFVQTSYLLMFLSDSLSEENMYWFILTIKLNVEHRLLVQICNSRTPMTPSLYNLVE